MNFPGSPVALLLFSLVGCAPPPQPPQPTEHDRRLGEWQKLDSKLAETHTQFVSAAAGYEKAMSDFQKGLIKTMAEQKPTSRLAKQTLQKSRDQVAPLVAERERVGGDLAKAFDALVAARGRRGQAILALMRAEAQLTELEARTLGSKAQREQGLDKERAELESVLGQLEAQQRARSEALHALLKKEVEIVSVGSDVKKRDQADQELDQLHDQLDKSLGSQLETERALAVATASLHQRALVLVPTGPKRELLAQRVAARTGLVNEFLAAEEALKGAISDRASQTKQRIGFESEIDHLVEIGLTVQVKAHVLEALGSETAAVAQARTAMQAQDLAASEHEGQLLALEVTLHRLAM